MRCSRCPNPAFLRVDPRIVLCTECWLEVQARFIDALNDSDSAATASTVRGTAAVSSPPNCPPGETAANSFPELPDFLDRRKSTALAAHEIYGPNKTGIALFYAIGCLGDERGCQRYAAGSVKPPAYVLRKLLRSPQGWVWLCETMKNCDEPWWRNVRLAVAYEAKRNELDARSV